MNTIYVIPILASKSEREIIAMTYASQLTEMKFNLILCPPMQEAEDMLRVIFGANTATENPRAFYQGYLYDQTMNEDLSSVRARLHMFYNVLGCHNGNTILLVTDPKLMTAFVQSENIFQKGNPAELTYETHFDFNSSPIKVVVGG